MILTKITSISSTPEHSLIGLLFGYPATAIYTIQGECEDFYSCGEYTDKNGVLWLADVVKWAGKYEVIMTTVKPQEKLDVSLNFTKV